MKKLNRVGVAIALALMGIGFWGTKTSYAATPSSGSESAKVTANVYGTDGKVIGTTRDADESNKVYGTNGKVIGTTRDADNSGKVYGTNGKVIGTTRDADESSNVYHPDGKVVGTTRDADETGKVYGADDKMIGTTRANNGSVGVTTNVYDAEGNTIGNTRSDSEILPQTAEARSKLSWLGALMAALTLTGWRVSRRRDRA
ncbi:type 1 periplasmic-binding domain-containing protein [Levilactobacillus fujinensis]|uniref:Gram-positive cocci surface proteins LPxTG domain-containing protein n=1 Tax=Levilactobacillus fujinensis TaxID=2486024 RepID=A0ABW1TI87_9LACO